MFSSHGREIGTQDALKKESRGKKATYCRISNCMTFWKRQNYGDSKRINGCQGLGMEVCGRGE